MPKLMLVVVVVVVVVFAAAVVDLDVVADPRIPFAIQTAA
jgi:hypothetical protein